MSKLIDPDKLFSQPGEKEKAMFSFYKANPAIACVDLLGQDLAPFQRVVINTSLSHSHVINVLARGSGKTRMMAYIAAYEIMFNPKKRVGFLGPQFRCPCVETTYCFTENGILSGKELKKDINIESLYKDNKIEEYSINKDEEGLEVITEKGFYIAGLNDHKVMTLDLNNYDTIYKNLEDLTENDYILIKNNLNYWNKNKQEYKKYINNYSCKNVNNKKDFTKLKIENINSDTFYLLGLITGDGYIDEKRERIGYCSADNDLINYYTNILNNILDKEIKLPKRDNRNLYNSDIISKCLFNFMKYLGFKPNCKAQGKDIPLGVRTAPKEYVTSFIQGLYDTDGTVSSNSVKFTSSSFVLAHQLHVILLNYGIVSSLYKHDGAGEITICGVKTIGRDFYDVVINNKSSIKKFEKEIGFRLKRKKDILKKYISRLFSDKKIDNVFPDLGKQIKNISKLNKVKNYKINCLSDDAAMSMGMRWVENLEYEYGIKDNILSNIRKIYDLDLFAVKVKEIKKKIVKTFAAQVEKEHCYVGNGLINHNTAKLAFNEFIAIYDESIYLQACIKRISRQSDIWTADSQNGAVVMAMPLAADSKVSVRGIRLHTGLLDEYPHVPKEVLDAVINPMLATQRNPMMNVRRIEKEKDLLKRGLITEDDLRQSDKNKVIGFSSAYFQFNHMYKTINTYKELMKKQIKETGKTDYAVNIFNYKDAPEGFFDMAQIEHARETTDPVIFRMEYLSEFPSDTDGFFKRSLLDSCVARGQNSFDIELIGEKDAKYFIGVDPARQQDNFAIAIVKLVGEEIRLARMITFTKTPFPAIAQFLRTLTKQYNVERLGTDAQGGGVTLKDLLENPMTANDMSEILLNIDDENNIGKKGRRIVRLFNFAPNWISEVNHELRASMEHGRFKFPSLTEGTTYIKPEGDVEDVKDQSTVEFFELLNELQSIQVTATRTGVLHFDTPKERMRKDRYSALLVAHKLAYDHIQQGFQVKELASGGWLGDRGLITDEDIFDDEDIEAIRGKKIYRDIGFRPDSGALIN